MFLMELLYPLSWAGVGTAVLSRRRSLAVRRELGGRRLVTRPWTALLLSPLLVTCGSVARESAPTPAEARSTIVDSYRLVDVEPYNRGIDQALEEGKHWPRSSLRVVSQYFAGPEEAGRISLTKVDGPGENPDSSTVTVIEEGQLDDSIAGKWFQFRLDRDDEGVWRVVEIRTADRCARGDYQTLRYGARLCP